MQEENNHTQIHKKEKRLLSRNFVIVFGISLVLDVCLYVFYKDQNHLSARILILGFLSDIYVFNGISILLQNMRTQKKTSLFYGPRPKLNGTISLILGLCLLTAFIYSVVNG